MLNRVDCDIFSVLSSARLDGGCAFSGAGLEKYSTAAPVIKGVAASVYIGSFSDAYSSRYSLSFVAVVNYLDWHRMSN